MCLLLRFLIALWSIQSHASEIREAEEQRHRSEQQLQTLRQDVQLDTKKLNVIKTELNRLNSESKKISREISSSERLLRELTETQKTTEERIGFASQELKNSLETLSNEDEKTIVFITHKLKEIKEFTETIFVMKNGQMVAEDLETTSVNDKDLITLMMGEIDTAVVEKNNEKGDIKLEVENISLETDAGGFNNLNDINLSIKAGEILGVAGVSGNGQVELANIVSGIQSNFDGKVTIKGQDVTEKGVRARKKLNLSYIPENRLGVGLAPGVSILDNSVVREYFSASYGPHLSKNKMVNYLNLLVKEFSIKTGEPKAEISTLSGGNMQKVLMGRELISNPEVIVAAQPTRGLDVSAVETLHELIVDQRNKGSAIMLISEDLDELFKLSDRIIVLYEGKIIKEFEINEANTNNVGLAMAGVIE